MGKNVKVRKREGEERGEKEREGKNERVRKRES